MEGSSRGLPLPNLAGGTAVGPARPRLVEGALFLSQMASGRRTTFCQMYPILADSFCYGLGSIESHIGESPSSFGEMALSHTG